MSRFLQSLLGAQESLFSSGLTKLEKTTGYSGVDTRLIADIIEKSHSVMRELGLDTSDTTGRELYFALNEAVKRGDGEWLLVDTDYVLMPMDDTVISFNLIDVIENMHHGLPFKRQIISHGQRSLRGELVKRYIDHKRTDEVTTRDIASLIGLLPESDEWYNNDKHNKKQKEKHSKETAE